MNKIDLIIDALNGCKGLTPLDNVCIAEALAAARELRSSIKEKYNPYEIGKRLQKEGYGLSDIGTRVKCDADIDQAIKGYCDQLKEQA